MTMPDETQRRPRILISITSTQSEKLLKKCFDALHIPIFYQCRAQGTAPSEILDILGMRGKRPPDHRQLPAAFQRPCRLRSNGKRAVGQAPRRRHRIHGACHRHPDTDLLHAQ